MESMQWLMEIESVVVYLSSLEDLFLHICNLATSLTKKQKPFEIVSIVDLPFGTVTQKPAEFDLTSVKDHKRNVDGRTKRT